MARLFAKVVTSNEGLPNPVGVGTTSVTHVVKNVIVAEPSFFDEFVDDEPGRWVETFEGMCGNVLYERDGTKASDQSGVGTMRANYAGLGHLYDIERDVFYDVQPHSSWTLDTSTYFWTPPVPKPDTRSWRWNETKYKNAVGAGTSTGAAWEFVDD